ncbi:UBN2 domain-containing protein [Cephalotus follicularis]|uniref:UBN2 domain-containing protein n=1 Tax=Cephalotus follicularis TaxID=3775 RepID=A0A1Q3BHY5_CEPFO|nr:UBN2 domain-containing protein [Cephalotus follicularis]
MFTRFTNIINSLKSIGKSYINNEIERNIIRSLHIAWRTKVTTNEKAKDLSTLPMEELIGPLMTHKLNLRSQEVEKVKKKKEKRKTIALKARKESDDKDQDELAMITRKFKRFLSKNKQYEKKPSRKTPKTKEEETKKLEEVTCYESNKTEHYKSDHPRLKKGKEYLKKKRAMIAT